MNNSYNGRVNIMTPDTSKLFALKDRIPVESTSFSDAMTGNWNDTILSNTFFSAQNVQILQNGLRAGVYNLSKGQYLIGPQNEDELKVVMRSVFLQYSRNLPDNISEQIASLNKLVLDYSIRQVYGEAEGYMKYKRDVSTMYCPLTPPVMSKTNDKQLILKKWF
jgi:hypothetical protein